MLKNRSCQNLVQMGMRTKCTLAENVVPDCSVSELRVKLSAHALQLLSLFYSLWMPQPSKASLSLKPYVVTCLSHQWNNSMGWQTYLLDNTQLRRTLWIVWRFDKPRMTTDFFQQHFFTCVTICHTGMVKNPSIARQLICPVFRNPQRSERDPRPKAPRSSLSLEPRFRTP